MAAHLERHGWSVWWDREIAAGEAFDEVIEEAVRATRCVVVLWSENSVGSRWVRAEAGEGANRDILVPVRLDRTDVPLGFRQIQAADLTAWRASGGDLSGEELVRDIRRILKPTDGTPALDKRATADSSPSVSTPAKTSANALRRPLVGVLALLVLVALALVFFGTGLWRDPNGDAASGHRRITSLAVLPLENLSGDPAQSYYASGLTEGLIADLSRISALRVISRQSVMRFEGSDKSLPEIAGELGVEALIEGSVLSAGDRVRVTAQLVQAQPEQNLWAKTYERDAEDVLALLSDVTRAISAEVRVAISPDEEALLANAPRVDPEAHRAYLRGAQAIRRLTPEDVTEAATFFRQAIDEDPTYAEPWAGLASYHLALEFYGLPTGAEDLRKESARKADAALARALELDSSLSQIYQLQGSIDFWRNWDWEGAEAGFRRSIELSPNDSNLRIYYALFLSAMGRHEEAAREADIAEELDPLSQLVHRFRGDIEYYAHDFDAAVRSYERSLELDPENLYVTGQMGFALFAQGKSDEAARAWQASRRHFGQEELALAMEEGGFEETARHWLEAAKDPAFTGISGPSVIAVVHAMLGEYEQALDWLEAGLDTGGDPGKCAGWMLPFVKQDPFLAPLHEDPRFQELLRRLNLAD